MPGPDLGGLMQMLGGGGGPQMPAGPSGPGGAGDLDALLGMQSAPPGAGEEEALHDATLKLGFALSRIHLRSPKAAKMLSEAVSKIQGARQELSQTAQQPVGPPPNLAMAEQGFIPGVTS